MTSPLWILATVYLAGAVVASAFCLANAARRDPATPYCRRWSIWSLGLVLVFVLGLLWLPIAASIVLNSAGVRIREYLRGRKKK